MTLGGRKTVQYGIPKEEARLGTPPFGTSWEATVPGSALIVCVRVPPLSVENKLLKSNGPDINLQGSTLAR